MESGFRKEAHSKSPDPSKVLKGLPHCAQWALPIDGQPIEQVRHDRKINFCFVNSASKLSNSREHS